MAEAVDIKKLERDLWEAADELRANSKLTSNEYCMPVLGLIFLRYAYSRYKKVEAEILKDRPVRRGRVMPIQASDFTEKSALYLPEEARYDYLVNLPEDVSSLGLTNSNGEPLNRVSEIVNNAMELIEGQSKQLEGVLPKEYTIFSDDLLKSLIRIFNNNALDKVGGDIIGRIYEYFLNKFAKNIASDDGVFFTPKSLVKMIVNILEPKSGVLLDPACGSGGMFVQTGDFVNQSGMVANNTMTFYGQEKVDYNAKLCLMNMAVHGLTGKIKSGADANTFYHDAHNLSGCCDYVMANPPFNVDKVDAESAQSAGRLPFGIPSLDKTGKAFGNANYLWISYFYSYLNEKGRAGFVMASSTTDSKDTEIREKLIKTGNVDVIISVGNNFFYTKSLPCVLWFFDKGKQEALKDKVLFIDAREYYTVVDRTLNEWSEWQLKNLNAIVWLYRGEVELYKQLLADYKESILTELAVIGKLDDNWKPYLEKQYMQNLLPLLEKVGKVEFGYDKEALDGIKVVLNELKAGLSENIKAAMERYTSLKAADYKKLQAELLASENFTLIGKNSEKKKLKEIEENGPQQIDALITVVDELKWLYVKFGEGEYQDIAGLCKIETKDVIINEKNSSLTPGAYVGVAEEEDDGVDFNERMKEIHQELLQLQEESNRLMSSISKSMEEMGL